MLFPFSFAVVLLIFVTDLSVVAYAASFIIVAAYDVLIIVFNDLGYFDAFFFLLFVVRTCHLNVF